MWRCARGTTYMENGKYFHHLSSNCIEYLLSCSVDSVQVDVDVDMDTQVSLYTVCRNKLYCLKDIDGNNCRYHMKGSVITSFVVHAKIIAIATNSAVNIRYRFIPLRTLCEDRTPSDRRSICLYTTHVMDESHFIKYSIDRCLPLVNIEDLSPFQITNAGYYRDLASIISTTDKVEKKHKYSPFSARLVVSQNHRAVVSYNISTMPSAGENADILLACIESVSTKSFDYIRDSNKAILSTTTKGRNLVGEFTMPIGCTDVGFHISTPYGFSCDMGTDPDTSLVKFNLFNIRYIPV